MQKLIPILNTWADEQIAPIGRAICSDFDKQPRITTTIIDTEMSVFMRGGLTRDEAWIFLSHSVAQFCPSYTDDIADYR